MRPRAGLLEVRLAGLLRSRSLLVGGTAALALATAAALAASRGPGAVRGVGTVLTGSTLVVALAALHGVVSGNVRSGVALLWLQKPVSPLRFYLGRGVEAAAMAVCLTLALAGGIALVSVVAGSPEAAAAVLQRAPSVALTWLCLGAVVFCCSAWGARLDGLLGLVFLVYFSWLAQEATTLGWPGHVLALAAAPLEELEVLGRALSGREAEGATGAVLQLVRHVMVWTALGLAGVAVTSRSPLPRNPSR